MRGRGSVSPTVVICQTTGQFLDPKTAIDGPRLELSEYFAKLYLNVTDDVTGWVKSQIFDYLHSLASPYKAAVSA